MSSWPRISASTRNAACWTRSSSEACAATSAGVKRVVRGASAGATSTEEDTGARTPVAATGAFMLPFSNTERSFGYFMPASWKARGK